MIALILGGAPSVWEEAERTGLRDRRHMVVAANLAGIHYPGRLDGWATLHPDLMAGWTAKRRGNKDFRTFVAQAHASSPAAEVVAERWPGSSGLYALQVALFEMNCTAAILCGVPMDTMTGHFSTPGAWAGTDDYRRAFEAALPEVGGRVRSMGGWTQRLFGEPTPEWINAVDNITPAGASAPPNARNDCMQHVKNGSDTTLSFWHRQENGLMAREHLAPGEAGDFEVDKTAPEFDRAGVTFTAVRAPAAPKAARTKTPAPKKPAPRKAAAPKPQEPAPPAPPVADAT